MFELGDHPFFAATGASRGGLKQCIGASPQRLENSEAWTARKADASPISERAMSQFEKWFSPRMKPERFLGMLATFSSSSRRFDARSTSVPSACGKQSGESEVIQEEMVNLGKEVGEFLSRTHRRIFSPFPDCRIQNS